MKQPGEPFARPGAVNDNDSEELCQMGTEIGTKGGTKRNEGTTLFVPRTVFFHKKTPFQKGKAA